MSRQVRVGGKAFFSQSLVFLTLLMVWKTSMHESHFVLEPLSITRTWALYTPPGGFAFGRRHYSYSSILVLLPSTLFSF